MRVRDSMELMSMILFPCSLASWTDEFLVSAARVARLAVAQFASSATDRTRYRFGTVACFAGHIIWFFFLFVGLVERCASDA